MGKFNIDFTYSIDDWIEVFKKLLVLIQDFFADLGIILFEPADE